MIMAVADTHATIWYVFGDPRLSALARQPFEQAAALGQTIGIPAIVFAEIVYLAEKQRIPANTFRRLSALLDEPQGVLDEVVFTRHMADHMQQIARTAIPELPDRMIAATALHLGVPLITRDHKIQSAGLPTIW